VMLKQIPEAKRNVSKVLELDKEHRFPRAELILGNILRSEKDIAGAAEHLRYARVANLAQATDILKDLGFWIVGLSADAPTLYTEFDYRRPLVLVIGAEGEGLHDLLRKKSDALVRLPMLGKVSSLNAAVAGSILLYEVIRQRGSL